MDAYHILPDATGGQFWKPNPAAGARTSLEAAASTELGDATGKDGGDSFVAVRTEPEKPGVKMAAPEGHEKRKTSRHSTSCEQSWKSLASCVLPECEATQDQGGHAEAGQMHMSLNTSHGQQDLARWKKDCAHERRPRLIQSCGPRSRERARTAAAQTATLVSHTQSKVIQTQRIRTTLRSALRPIS